MQAALAALAASLPAKTVSLQTPSTTLVTDRSALPLPPLEALFASRESALASRLTLAGADYAVHQLHYDAAPGIDVVQARTGNASSGSGCVVGRKKRGGLFIVVTYGMPVVSALAAERVLKFLGEVEGMEK